LNDKSQRFQLNELDSFEEYVTTSELRHFRCCYLKASKNW